ncbi:MAG: PCMD domain-containing protein [Coprobacter sp.]|nr:PCMD domain-containing protein [Coprobacter sp.]
MRKQILSLLALAGALLLPTSCIKDEEPNVECDIESIVVADNSLITNVKIDRDQALVSLKRKSADFASEINPSYVVSEGATYTVDSRSDNGAVHTEHVTVTSENKEYSKTYTVLYTPTQIPDSFSFEYWKTDGKFEETYEKGFSIVVDGEEIHYPDIDIYLWDSGNLGFSAVAGSKKAKEYPTFSTDIAAKGSYAARLITRKTGSLGATLNKPIAAGNIFLGDFSGDGINMLKEPLKATRMGYPYDKIPTSIEVRFKYKRGTYDYNDNVFKTREGGPDFCAFYAIFFDNVKAKEENPLDIPTLDGSNLFTSESIIAMANLHTCDDPEVRKYENGTDGEWVHIELPFKSYIEGVTDYREAIDIERLKAQEYSLTIVACASYYGDYFEGAIDSEMIIDDIKLHYETVE